MFAILMMLLIYFFTTAAKIEIYDMQNAAAVLQAFMIDPKSMEGITNKILKHKGYAN